jgi:hypothetical protein
MTLVSESSGTQTAIIGTEHTLAASTTAKTRVLSIDLSALTTGDTVTLRIKAKVLSGGAEAVAYTATYAHGQIEPVVYSIPIPSLHGATFTLQQTAGTGRSFPWTVATLD